MLGGVHVPGAEPEAEHRAELADGEHDRVVADGTEVAVVAGAFLLAVDLDLGGIEIHVDAARHGALVEEGVKPRLENGLGQGPTVGSPRKSLGLEPVQGRLPGERLSDPILSARGEDAAQDGVVAQVLGVGNVREPKDSPVDGQAKQILGPMADPVGRLGILQAVNWKQRSERSSFSALCWSSLRGSVSFPGQLSKGSSPSVAPWPEASPSPGACSVSLVVSLSPASA